MDKGFGTKGLRSTEQWFRRGLWLLALVFAVFLISLGSKIVNDLPSVEKVYNLEDFIDKAVQARLEHEKAAPQAALTSNTEEIEALEKSRALKEKEVSTAEENLKNWLVTRKVSEAHEQNPELVARTQKVEELRAQVRKINEAISAIEDKNSPVRAQLNAIEAKEAELNAQAQQKLDAANDKQTLRVFFYRLAFTLPLLLIAGWLFKKYRKSSDWPFVLGFIFFALFTFFVELVPYLPSYGGYVRYTVGVVLTIVIGRYVIRGMQSYLAKQALVEQLPQEARREELDYERALGQMVKNICPGCDRPISAGNESENFCGHCGIALFRNCPGCRTRKNAFVHYCKVCGLDAFAKPSEPTVGTQQPPLS